MTFALTQGDLIELYSVVKRPADLSIWQIDQPALLACAYAANLATVSPSSTWPRSSLPEPGRTLMTDDQLLFVLNSIEGARQSGRVWTSGDII